MKIEIHPLGDRVEVVRARESTVAWFNVTSQNRNGAMPAYELTVFLPDDPAVLRAMAKELSVHARYVETIREAGDQAKRDAALDDFDPSTLQGLIRADEGKR